MCSKQVPNLCPNIYLIIPHFYPTPNPTKIPKLFYVNVNLLIGYRKIMVLKSFVPIFGMG